MEKLVECNRCKGDACYEQQISQQDGTDITTWLCMGCGFTSSTLMVEDSKIVTDLLETSPELYKDLLFKDSNGFIWSPSTITLPGKGMVFVDGTSKDNWEWAAAKTIDLTEEELASGKYPQGQTVKMDMANVKKYSSDEYMDAMEEIGFFNLQG